MSASGIITPSPSMHAAELSHVAGVYGSVRCDARKSNSNLSVFEVWQQELDLYLESDMTSPHGANIVANDEIIAKMLQEELESVTSAEASEAAGAIVPVFKHLQALMSQIWVEGVALATRTGQVSTHLAHEGVTQYWDGGKMEIVGDGNYSADDEMQATFTLSFNHDAPHYVSDEDDHKKLLVLSDDSPHD